MLYGRDDLVWDQLADAGLAFLIERARLGKLTSYTELNATLVSRTGLPGFDFSRADERAAMGHLLYLMVEKNSRSWTSGSCTPVHCTSSMPQPLRPASCSDTYRRRRVTGAESWPFERTCLPPTERRRIGHGRVTYCASSQEQGPPAAEAVSERVAIDGPQARDVIVDVVEIQRG
jgi:hypothetical protein